MKIFRITSLTFISALLLLLPGCHIPGYVKAGKPYPAEQPAEAKMPFAPGFGKALYKAALEVNGRGFSGLMMIKAFEDGKYRIAFFSEVGLNFFDLELQPSAKPNKMEMAVNNIYSPLDRAFLLKKFEKYFSMLLARGPVQSRYDTYRREEGEMAMALVDSYRGRDAYLGQSPEGPYTGISNYGGLFHKERITITLAPAKDSQPPHSILIVQAGFRLSFRLDLVE